MSQRSFLRKGFRNQRLMLQTLEERLTPAYDVSLLDLNTINQDVTGSSSPDWITPVGNIIIFAADDGTNGRELWRSNGTASGTFMIKDIYPGVTGSIPRDLVEANGLVYFTANNGNNGRELWKTDGTAGGTVMVTDIASGALSAFSLDPDTSLTSAFSPQEGRALGWTTNVNGTVFFEANDGKTGFELWKTDGTAANTVQVKNISPDSLSTIGSSTPVGLCAVGNTLYFSADNYNPVTGISNGRELWKSDGTANGTSMVRDINPGSAPSYPGNFYSFNNKLYFTIEYPSSSSGGLWVSDGTALTTKSVADILLDGTSLGSSGSPFIASNGQLYFSASTSSYGSELYKSDGLTSAGTSIVSDFNPGYGSGANLDFNYDSNISVTDKLKANAVSYAGKLYYTDGDGGNVSDSHIIASDGTVLGTQILKSYTNSYARALFGPMLGNSILYSITGGSDGSVKSSINSIRALNTTDNSDSVIGLEGFFANFTTRMQSAGGKVFFGATEGSVGTELWVVREVNAPPVVSNGLAGRTSSAGSSVSFSVASSFSDPNSDTLTFTATGLPTGLAISSAGLISGTILSTAATGSPYTTRVTANDGNGGTVTSSFTWTVLPPNRNPVAGPIANRTSGVSDVINVSIASSFSDPDNDLLTFSATNLPAGLAISSTGLITGTILSNANTSTPYSVTVSVADGRGGTASGSFSWTINAANRPPVVVSLADRSDITGNRVSFVVGSAFSDPDFDSLTFTATGLPDGLSISTGGLVTGTVAVTAAASSPFTARITASDGRGGSVTGSFIWTVSAGVSIPHNTAFDLIGLTDLRSNLATAGIDGTGIGVAVIDTGIDYAHTLFQSGGNSAYYTTSDVGGGLIPVGRDFTGDAAEGTFNPGDARNRYSSSRFNTPSVNQRNAAFVAAGGGQDNVPEDTNGHGTHVAGIIGARNPDIGVATGSKLIGLKVLGADGLGSNENVLKALEWVRDNAAYYNIKVVNMSLGYGFYSTLGEDDPFTTTISDLEALGITIVSAAGNLYGLTPTERNSSTPGIASTLTVGAVWKDGSINQAYWPEGDTYDYTTGAGRLASFSQRPSDVVDNGIFAPGALMLSAIPNSSIDPTRGDDLTAELAGTSQAAPVVSGVVALMQDAAFRAGGRYLSPTEVRQVLFQSATTVNDGDNEDDGFARDPNTLQYTLDNNTHSNYRLINANSAIALVRSMFDTPSQPDDPNGVITSPVELAPDYTRSQIADINPSLDAGNPLRYTPIVAGFQGEIGKDGETLVGGKDVDLYAFSVDLSGALTIRTTRASDTSPVVNTQLRLFDSDGNEITVNVDNRADNDPSSDLNGIFDPFSTLKVRLEPGRYFIGVSGQGNSSYSAKTELSGSEGQTVLGVKATGPYHLTMDYLTQDPNGLLAGALETYLQVTGAAVQRGFLGGDYLSSSADIVFPRPDQLDPAYGGTVVDAGAVGVDGRLSHTIATRVADVDLFIMTAPENGYISLDIDSLDYTTSNNDPGIAADTFVRAWLVNGDGTLTELGSNDNGYNPDERLIGANGALVGDDSSQSTGFDSFLKVQVSAGDRILFGVSDHFNQGYDPLNFGGRQSSANSHVGFFDAFATFTSNDLNGRIGLDIYNPDPVGTVIGILPTVSQTFSIGFDDQTAAGGSSDANIGLKDVDFYAYSAPANGTLFVDVDSLEAAGISDSVGTVITVFEIVVDASGFRTLNVVGTSVDASGTPSGIDPKLGVQVTANRQYYVAISGSGNSSFNPFRHASGTNAFDTGTYRLESSFAVQNTVSSDPPITVFRPANRTRFSSARLGYDASGAKVSGNDLDTFVYTPTSNGTITLSVLPGAESAASPSFRVFSQTGSNPYAPVNSTATRPGSVTINVTQGTKYAVAISGSRNAISTNGVSFQSAGSSRGSTGTYTLSIDDSKLTAPPILTGPSSKSFTISSSSPVTGFTISDSDAASTLSTLTASVDRGTLTAGGKSGGVITLTGTVAQLNAAIAGLTFKSANLDAIPAKLSFSAKDASGNTALLTAQLTPTENLITTITDPELAAKKSVLIVGTSGSDSISLVLSGSTYRVTMNGRTVSLTGITGRVIAFGLAGNDTIEASTLTIPTAIYGGDGDDIVRSGSGADKLFGENGADLLAGGLGVDIISGGSDNDLLFDGVVAPKTASVSLASTLALWKSFTNPTEAQYTTIYNRLAITSDKSSKDTLQGANGLDLFFASITDVLDKLASERSRFV